MAKNQVLSYNGQAGYNATTGMPMDVIDPNVMTPPSSKPSSPKRTKARRKSAKSPKLAG